MAGPDFQISIDEILGDKPWVKLPIDDLETGNVQARQSDTDVKEDDKLVGAIRRTKGIIHPIVVKDLKTDPKKYEIIIGQRRTGAYHILKNEDSRYNEIKAYVVERDLTDNEIRIISFVENDVWMAHLFSSYREAVSSNISSIIVTLDTSHELIS